MVWGGVPELLIAGFDTLVEAGFSPEIALLECVGELKLIADLIDERGIAGMREAISNTAELGAFVGRPAHHRRGRARAHAQILSEVRAGRFAEELRQEEASGYRAARARAGRCAQDSARGDFQETARPRLKLSRPRPERVPAGRRRLPVRDRRAGACDGLRRSRGRSRRPRAPALPPLGARNRYGQCFPSRRSLR